MAWRQGFPKRSLQNSETAWPGELKKLVFDLCWGDLQCQTLRQEPLKKRRFVPLQDLLRRPVLG